MASGTAARRSVRSRRRGPVPPLRARQGGARARSPGRRASCGVIRPEVRSVPPLRGFASRSSRRPRRGRKPLGRRRGRTDSRGSDGDSRGMLRRTIAALPRSVRRCGADGNVSGALNRGRRAGRGRLRRKYEIRVLDRVAALRNAAHRGTSLRGGDAEAGRRRGDVKPVRERRVALSSVPEGPCRWEEVACRTGRLSFSLPTLGSTKG